LALLALLALSACEDYDAGAYARRIQSPHELIGGPSALGTVGDYLIGNNHVRVVLQDQGWSRGFGMFGGGVIDADIVRPGAEGNSAGGTGRDNFGEFFPAFFLEAFEVRDFTYKDPDTGEELQAKAIEIINDGSDGRDAVIRTRARGGNFITMVENLLKVALPRDSLAYETDYILAPGARHLRIVGRVRNTSRRAVDLPSSGFDALLSAFGAEAFPLPFGDVALFGAGNAVYAPGAVTQPGRDQKPIGFDIRFSVDASYRFSYPLPGLVVDFLATAGPGVSYGYAVGDDAATNMVWQHRERYQQDPLAPVSEHAMLLPFLIESFTGAYYVLPPARLGAGEYFEYTKYLIIGHGDVASVRDELYKIRGATVGTFFGEVQNERRGDGAADVWLHVFDAARAPYSQVEPDGDGRFRCSLAPGDYYYVVTGEGRRPFPEPRFTDASRFTVRAGKGTHRIVRVPEPAELQVQVRDKSGRPLPAKVSLVRSYSVPDSCRACTGGCDAVCDPRNYLFELALGEERRATDLSWRDRADRGEYVEAFFYSDASGAGQRMVRPGQYDVVVTRGAEYEPAVLPAVTLQSGRRSELHATLERVVDTPDYVAADLHVHSQGSVDSFVNLEDRVLSGVAEGLEVLVSSDHNFVADFAPTIKSMGLQDWVTSVVGVELSTLEMGHFNAFPLRGDPSVPSHFPLVDICFPRQRDRVNGTAFDWVQCRPQQMFDGMRALGEYSAEDTIVQVNHPRTNILGYFNQYYLNPHTALVEDPTEDNYPFSSLLRPQNLLTGQWKAENFSYDFDAIEVANGKRLDNLHAFVTPAGAGQDVLDEISDFACGSGHHANGAGKPLLRKGGHATYPGAVDDWITMTTRGLAKTATGNSDSHSLAHEMGSFRTYLRVAQGDSAPGDAFPGRVHALDVVEALRRQQAIVTNGPFLELSVVTAAADGGATVTWPIGSTVTYPGAGNVGREVVVLLSVKSNSLARVDRVVLYANGTVLDDIAIGEGGKMSRRLVYSFQEDTVLIAEAYGSGSMFPLITPNEDPPTNVGRALSAVIGSVSSGLSPDEDGVRGPDFIQRVTPYALTNPIWLDLDDKREDSAKEGFTPPAQVQRAGPGPAKTATFAGCTEDAHCAFNQVCDVARGVCQCAADAGAMRAPAFVRLEHALYLPPQAGSHFPPMDIRRVFAEHMGH
jgi:hypothetical protein